MSEAKKRRTNSQVDPEVDGTTYVGCRIPTTLAEWLDLYASQMRDASPGLRFSRSDAVRVILNKAKDKYSI